MWVSVTRAIPHDFSGVSPEVLEAAAKRGTDVHTACAAYMNNLFIPDSVLFGDRVGYFESFKRWFDKYVKRVFFVEHEFKCDRFKFLGHVDLVAELVDGRLVVVDLKTPAALVKTWRLQLAAYRYLVSEELRKKKIKTKIDCMSLQLMKDGRAAKAVPYLDNENDFVVFLSCLNVYRFLNS
jgi:hypothetical protein